MKNFTLSILCAVAALLCSASANAQLSITDVFGKYEFSANLEITDAGKDYADLFKATGEVTIKADDSYWLAQVSPFAGGVETHYVNKLDAANNKFIVYNTNGNSYYYWGSLAIANINGDYPYGGADTEGFEMEYTYDPETGNISLPDFTAVSCRAPEDPVVVMAKFTNCKLTLVEKETIEIVDLTGEYAFVGQYCNSDSDFPTTFDLTLTATSDDFKNYNATIKYDAYEAIKIEGVRFDGNTLTMPIDYTYIDKETPYLFATYNPMSFQGDITFSLIGKGKLSLYSGIVIATLVDVTEEGSDTPVKKGKRVQWYGGGVAKDKSIKEMSFAGTYVVNCPTPMVITESETNWPKEFSIVVEQIETGDHYVTEFMGYDTYMMNYGGIPCKVEDNKLLIEAGGYSSYLNTVDMQNDGYIQTCDILYDPVGEVGEIVLTLNEDGSYELSDFIIRRVTMDYTVYAETENVMMVFYSQMSVASGIKDVDAVSAPAKVYNLNGVCVGNSIDSLPKGVYVIKRGDKAVKVAK